MRGYVQGTQVRAGEICRREIPTYTPHSCDHDSSSRDFNFFLVDLDFGLSSEAAKFAAEIVS